MAMRGSWAPAATTAHTARASGAAGTSGTRASTACAAAGADTASPPLLLGPTAARQSRPTSLCCWLLKPSTRPMVGAWVAGSLVLAARRTASAAGMAVVPWSRP
ncbi:hypothetical protein BCR44DRAFT_1430491, partial [Catenaria anguillulae PL171]